MRFEQGMKVSVERIDEGHKGEIAYGIVDSVPDSGLWVTWDTEFAFAHRNVFLPYQSQIFKRLEIVNESD